MSKAIRLIIFAIITLGLMYIYYVSQPRLDEYENHVCATTTFDNCGKNK